MFLVAVAASASSKVGKGRSFPSVPPSGPPLAPSFSADGTPTVLVIHENAKNCLFQLFATQRVAPKSRALRTNASPKAPRLGILWCVPLTANGKQSKLISTSQVAFPNDTD